MLKVGVIGLGMGQFHLEAYSRLEDVRILALCDRSEKLLTENAQKHKVTKTFTDYRKMLELDELSAVSIAIPNFLHCTVTLDALSAGKHVLIEKPMAMNSEEAEKMIEKAKQKRKVLAVGMNYRFSPERILLKRIIGKGELGEIYYVKAVSLRRRTFPREFFESGDPKTWFVKKETSGGGSLIDMGPHLLDLSMWYCDDFNPVSAYGVTSYKMKNGNIDDLSCAIIKLKTGVVLNLESTWESFTTPSFYISLLGTRGGATTNPLRIHKAIDGAYTETIPVDAATYSGGDSDIELCGLQRHFVDCITKGEECQVSGEKGLAVMKIIDAVYESAETGKEVTIRP